MKRTKRNDRLAPVRKLRAIAMAGMQDARDNAAVRVEEARARAVDAANRFERAFVTRAMSRLGVPTAREVRALSREVATLKASVQRLSRSRARA